MWARNVPPSLGVAAGLASAAGLEASAGFAWAGACWAAGAAGAVVAAGAAGFAASAGFAGSAGLAAGACCPQALSSASPRPESPATLSASRRVTRRADRLERIPSSAPWAIAHPPTLEWDRLHYVGRPVVCQGTGDRINDDLSVGTWCVLRFPPTRQFLLSLH